MSGEEQAASVSATIEKSGTLEPANSHVPNALAGVSRLSQSDEDAAARDGDEKALEWHEVIELQAFSERKVWIEEKIKFLESLPPIEVFVGLDAVRSSAEEVPGLPSRSQLQEWLQEHDRIEKETEIFDSGELRKLKKFTKAATQRNLSLADTDLIELTLTTIYELDKLLHLLRDRSDNLELLNIRLTWEERRIASWVELRKVVADLRDFLGSRARWSPSVYDVAVADDELVGGHQRKRSGSFVSITSTTSESSYMNAPGLARSSRFRLAETLTRDAAQFASRASSLRHTKIAGAGKTLDKLIDHSRKPVPEELLDEQDQLENQGINEMEDIGKFVMGVVMQWKKADEIYVETMKDKTAALTLLEEIEVANMHHPTARQDAAFLSRSTALMKRLTMRGNPSLLSSVFPRPTHHLYPDQSAANESVVRLLSSELSSAIDEAKKVEACAKEYHASYEAVKRVETACKAASDLSLTLVSLIERLQTGIATANGDGTPPDLSTEACLDASRHSVFLAMLPATVEELRKADKDASNLLPGARAALLHLDRPGIDDGFKSTSASEIEGFAAHRTAASRASEEAVGHASILHDVRQVWFAMEHLFQDLESIRDEIPDAIERQMWRQQMSSHGAPPTPETPTTELAPTTISPASIFARLDTLQVRMNQEVSSPCRAVIFSVGPALKDYLSECSTNLDSFLSRTTELARFWESVLNQAAIMGNVRDEVHSLQIQMEDLKVRFDKGIQDVLAGDLVGDALLLTEGGLTSEVKRSQDTLQAFLADLPHRVPFTGGLEMSSVTSSKRTSLSGSFSLDIVRQAAPLYLPFDPAILDHAVRADSNAYSMMLSGVLKVLEQKTDHFQLAKTAKTIDLATETIVNSIRHAVESAEVIRQSVAEFPDNIHLLDHLALLSEEVNRLLQTDGLEIPRSFSPVRDLLHRLKSVSGDAGANVRDSLLISRQRALEEAEVQYNSWKDRVSSLQQQIAKALDAERSRLAEEARLQEEPGRLEVEERAKLEQLLSEAEERARREREQLEVEERARREQEEAERLAKAEEERLGKEQVVAEEREKAEQQRLWEEREAERVQLEAGEKQRLERVTVAGREVGERRRLEAQELEAKATPGTDTEVSGLQEPALREKHQRAVTPLEVVKESDMEDSITHGVPSLHVQEDVFGIQLFPSAVIHRPPQKRSDLQTRIYHLRKRLCSIHINDVARPALRSGDSLPGDELRQRMANQFSAVIVEVDHLPPSLPDNTAADTDLRSLRSEVSASTKLMQKVHRLADLTMAVGSCDSALSDLLEHVDSYPSPPLGPLSSSYTTNTALTPEKQMSDRLSFTKDVLEKMQACYSAVPDDSRATVERDRVLQTWSELQAMGLDRVSGQKSRPPSVISTGRSSRSSGKSNSGHQSKKSTGYSKLSVGSTGGFLAPLPQPHPRRSSAGASAVGHSRSASRASATSSIRSVSSPISPSSTLYGSTFSSRQRTASISSASSMTTPAKRVQAAARPRAQIIQADRTASPALTEISSRSTSRPRFNSSLSSTPHSTWARVPRQSLSAAAKVTSPPAVRAPPGVKKPYVADPKNKLDVAVGDVVNKLSANINVEVVADTWKDQSGKYWIGDQEPKLCFCRILRSQTVMVRVGGGWSELSKFIKDHFADAFRILPESPPRPPRASVGSRDEKWVNSATFSQAVDNMFPYQPPGTPLPNLSFIPSFALSTPGGSSPKSIRSASPPSTGSPLTALQFFRRAGRDSPSLRAESPSRSSRSMMSSMSSVLNTPASSRPSVWRP
ncbi:hypothetical protein BKA93DRAFT_728696 [Sparassis latifolia]